MLIVATGKMLIMPLHHAPMFFTVARPAVGQIRTTIIAAWAFRFRWHYAPPHSLSKQAQEKAPPKQCLLVCLFGCRFQLFQSLDAGFLVTVLDQLVEPPDKLPFVIVCTDLVLLSGSSLLERSLWSSCLIFSPTAPIVLIHGHHQCYCQTLPRFCSLYPCSKDRYKNHSAMSLSPSLGMPRPPK